MTREKFLGSDEEVDKLPDETLRPSRLQDVIGQRAVVERLRVSLDAAKMKGEALQHILLDGPPGLGKTTLATVLPKELGVELVFTSGPALKTPKDVMPYLTNLTERAVLFIDEIHRLPSQVEEFIYPAMEDYRIDIVIGEGLGARTLSMPLKKFTVIGATTRSGKLTAPLRDRFVIREHLDYYEDDELIRILSINAKKLGVPMEHEALLELAQRSRGTPRVANSHLYWIRNYAISRGDGRATLDLVREALAMQEIDAIGLDRQDRRYLQTLIRVFNGGPAGVEAIAATMNVPSDTLADEVEPYLLRRELIVRTPRGRQATRRAFDHIGITPTVPQQGSLFHP